ncbi:MAG: hypothetical protein LBN07_05075 [Christensenellaceae bacterium]|jgi:hypothetical protein|nr:hypothetical protein [Christensenellaceae bacterium]
MLFSNYDENEREVAIKRIRENDKKTRRKISEEMERIKCFFKVFEQCKEKNLLVWIFKKKLMKSAYMI